MSDLHSWFKAREDESFFENLSATGLQTMKDYLYGSITTADAAIKYTANINIQDLNDKDMYNHLAYLVIPGYQVSGLYVQGQVVKLLAAIRDLRYKSWEASQSIHLGKASAPELVLTELCIILSEEYDSMIGCQFRFTMLSLGTKFTLLMLIKISRPFERFQ